MRSILSSDADPPADPFAAATTPLLLLVSAAITLEKSVFMAKGITLAATLEP